MYKGLFNFSCTIRGVDMECYVDYEEEEEATFDDPGTPEYVQVFHAHVGGVDVIDLLSDSVIDEIEEKALEAMMDYGE